MRNFAILALCWAWLCLAETQAQRDTIIIVETEEVRLDSLEMDSSEVEVEDDDDLSFEIRIGRKEPKIRRRWPGVRTRVLMLDYGISAYTHEGSFNMPSDLNAVEQTLWGSHYFGLHVIRQSIDLMEDRKMDISYGLTFDFSRYKFTNDLRLLPNQEEVVFEDTGEELRRNQLRTTHLSFPVWLTFRFAPKEGVDKDFKVSLGGYASLLISSRTRYRSDSEGKVRNSDDFNLNKVQYGLTARAGYSYFNLFLNYNMTPFFNEADQGVYDLRGLSFGVAIIPF